VPKPCIYAVFWDFDFAKNKRLFFAFCIIISRDIKNTKRKYCKKTVFMRVFGVFAVTTRPKSFFANFLVNLLGISITLFMEIMSPFSTIFSFCPEKR